MPTVFTLAYNEAPFIQFMIEHYRTRFPDCPIVVYDNQSTDDTVKIAKDNGCRVVSFDTQDKFDELTNIEIKRNAWKSAETDWVIVCDTDELIDINQEDLVKEASCGSSIIRFEAYDMVNMENNSDWPTIKYGVRNKLYDKLYLFNRKRIYSINYLPGAHFAGPIGDVTYSTKVYPAYHYKYLSEDYLISRYDVFSARLSDSNRKNGWTTHCLISENQIREDFLQRRKVAQKVIP